MLKKIVVGTIATALVAVLVIGAVNRTNVKLGDNVVAGGNGRSAGTAQTGEAVAGGRWSKDAGELAAGGGRGRQGGNELSTDGGRGAQGNENVTEPGVGEANVDEWVTLNGSVMSVDTDTLTVRLADGTALEVAERAWSFAQEQGFTAAHGDQLTLVGFYEDGSFEVGHLNNVSAGKQVAVRDSSGRPLWAGRARGRTG